MTYTTSLAIQQKKLATLLFNYDKCNFSYDKCQCKQKSDIDDDAGAEILRPDECPSCRQPKSNILHRD